MQVFTFLEQYNCAFNWVNKRSDNIKMHGDTVKKNRNCCIVKQHVLFL